MHGHLEAPGGCAQITAFIWAYNNLYYTADGPRDALRQSQSCQL